jgi:hypothetical protein
MENLFKGCTNLSDLNGFEKLDTSKLDNINEMFVNCTNLIVANFSSFDLGRINQTKKIFQNNTSLQYVDLRNSRNINLSEIFSNDTINNNSDIKIILNEKEILREENKNYEKWIRPSSNFTMTCKKGNHTENTEECKECNINSLECSDCYDGYFLTNSKIFTKKRCRKCNKDCKNKCYDDENGKIICNPDETDLFTNYDEEDSSFEDSSDGVSRRCLLSIELPPTKFISKEELQTTDLSSKELITKNLRTLALPKNELTDLQTNISPIKNNQNNDFLTKDLSASELARKDLSSNELPKTDQKDKKDKKD